MLSPTFIHGSNTGAPYTVLNVIVDAAFCNVEWVHAYQFRGLWLHDIYIQSESRCTVVWVFLEKHVLADWSMGLVSPETVVSLVLKVGPNAAVSHYKLLINQLICVSNVFV